MAAPPRVGVSTADRNDLPSLVFLRRTLGGRQAPESAAFSLCFNGPEGQPCCVGRGADAPVTRGGRAARGPTEAGGPICTERNPTEEERQAGKRRLNTASSGPPPFVARKRRASGGANGAPGRAPRKRRSHCAAYHRVAAPSNSTGSLILAAQRADEEEGL